MPAMARTVIPRTILRPGLRPGLHPGAAEPNAGRGDRAGFP